MKTRSTTFRLTLLVALFALTATACGLFDNLTAGNQVGSDNADATAQALSATQSAVLTAQAGSDGEPAEDFFVEQFEGSLPDWTDFILGEGLDADTSIVNGQFIFDIQSVNTFAYTLYDGNIYTDVQLTTNVENRGHENNYITLICRESADGWYELSIASDGFYSIDFADDATDSFENLAAGSTDTINLGAASNEFTAICQGDQLSLYVNGEFVDNATDSRLPEGHVGISAASLEDLPILVAFDYLEVSQP
jgi:hypothetical protein